MRKNVLITGASKGIGLACAKEFLISSSYHVTITSRLEENLATAKYQLTQPDAGFAARITTIVCDHSDSAEVDRLVEKLSLLCLQPLILIANLGINVIHQLGPMKVQSIPYQVFQQSLTTNVTNTFYLISQLLPSMKKHKFGRIILIGSRAYKLGLPGQSVYNTSKSALFGLMKSIANEYCVAGITCNLINPGLVDTERTKKVQQRLSKLEDIRLSHPEEIAKWVVFLSGEDSPYLNGNEIDV